MSSYLKDSQHLMQESSSLKLEQNIKIHVGDFENLYLNITHNEAILIITELYSELDITNKHFNIIAFNKILKLALNNNFFKFKKKFFKQIIGIAMGSKCGPAVANLVVYYFERTWLKIQKPLFYKRYLDDVMAIDNKDISSILSAFGNLKLNLCSGVKQNFLDLIIEFDKITNSLFFSMYIKPTNSRSFLNYESNHPNFILKNIPKSQFIRIRRICSRMSDYFYFTRRLIFQLIQLGYDFKKLNKLSLSISKLDRADLI
ncbi:unnamed protein product, partial [Brachionus calyciflorus]